MQVLKEHVGSAYMYYCGDCCRVTLSTNKLCERPDVQGLGFRGGSFGAFIGSRVRGLGFRM